MTNKSRRCCTQTFDETFKFNDLLMFLPSLLRSTAERVLPTQTHESDSATAGLFLFAVTVPDAELTLCVLQPSCPLIMCRWRHHHLRLRLTAFNTKSFHSFLTNNHFVQDLESKLMWTSQNKEQTPAQHLPGRLSLTGSSVSFHLAFLWFTYTPEVLYKHTGCME